MTAWFTLMAYGKDGYREIVERCCNLASKLSAKVAESKNFELLAPTNFNVVTFTFAESYSRISTEKVNDYLSHLTADGKVFMTPTVYKGVPGIRAALCNWRTTTNDIEITWEAMTKLTKTFSEGA